MSLDLPRYTDRWDPDDPHANFKAEVAEHTRGDPLPMLENLSALTGIGVGSLIRYVLVRWGSDGHETLLHAGPRTVRRMADVCDAAVAAGDEQARLEAFEVLRQMIAWLAAPLEDDAQPPPTG